MATFTSYAAALGLLLLTPTLVARAQTLIPLFKFPLNEQTQRITYRGQAAVPGVARPELYGRAREWAVRTFEDARQVIQLDDPARGVLMGRGVTWVATIGSDGGPNRGFALNFLFCLRLTEGGYTYEFTDLSYQLAPNYTVINQEAVPEILAYQQQWQQSGQGTVEIQNHRRPLEPEFASRAQSLKNVVRLQLTREMQGVDATMQRLVASLEYLQQAPTAP